MTGGSITERISTVGRATGRVLLGCGLVAIAVVVVPPTGSYTYAGGRSLYGWAVWFNVVGLAIGAVAAVSSSRLRSRAVVIAVAFGAQVAGTGLVAWRRWFTSGGFTTPPLNLGLLRALALVLAGAGIVAVVVGSYFLVGRRTGRRRNPPRIPEVAVTAGIATAVALAVPLVMGYDSWSRTTQLGAHGLMYSLPWAFVFGLSSWLDRRVAVVGLVAVVISSVPLLTGEIMIRAPRSELAPLLLVITIAALVAARMRLFSHDVAET